MGEREVITPLILNLSTRWCWHQI